MARIIRTDELKSGEHDADESLWIYNGLDCCVTAEVLAGQRDEADAVARATYEYSKSLQGPIFEMNMRGLLIDQEHREFLIQDYGKDIGQVEDQLTEIVKEGIGVDLNWRSPLQLGELLYDVMAIPAIRKRNAKGGYSRTTNRDALEKLQGYFIAQPVVSHLLILRDLAKKVQFLKTGIDPDGRFRTNFNIAGTSTGRLSSAEGDLGGGSNAQNVEKKLRRVFIADPGMKFANIDLAQADARNVGALCWNLFVEKMGEDYAGRYLNATESGDLHTTVTRMAWSSLPWGDDPAGWRAVADQKGYRHLTYRDLAKKLGHGTNYYGQPATMAAHSKIEKGMVAEFQDRYFTGFPEIRQWHDRVRFNLQTNGFSITPFGRRRYFLGKRNDEATLREAIANDPQSMTADELNHCMLALWYLRQRTNLPFQFMIQVHDSLVLQYEEAREDEIIPQLLAHFKRPIILKNDREFCVPCDCQVGWNLDEWKKDGSNPDGLKGWGPGDDRKRTSFPKSLLERAL